VNKINESELLVDVMETEIQDFVVDLLQEEVNEYENKRAKYILHSTKELERMGDYVIDITHDFELLHKSNLILNEGTMLDFRRMLKATINITEDCVKLIGHRDELLAKQVIEKENIIDLLEVEARKRHSKRIRNKVSHRHEENKFIDLLSDIESISDSASSIAKFIFNFGNKPKEYIDYEFLDSLLEN